MFERKTQREIVIVVKGMSAPIRFGGSTMCLGFFVFNIKNIFI